MSLKSSQSQLNLSNGFKKRLLRPVSTHKQNDPKNSMKNSNLLSLHDHITVKNKYAEAKTILLSIQNLFMENQNDIKNNKNVVSSTLIQNLQSCQNQQHNFSLEKLIKIIKQEKQKKQINKKKDKGKITSSNSSTKSIQSILCELGAQNLQQGLKILYIQTQEMQSFLDELLYLLAVSNNNIYRTASKQQIDKNFRLNENDQKSVLIAKLMVSMVQHIYYDKKQTKNINVSEFKSQQQFLPKFKPILTYDDVNMDKQINTLKQQLQQHKKINIDLENKLKTLQNSLNKNTNQPVSINQIESVHKQIKEIYQDSLIKKDQMIIKLKNQLLQSHQQKSNESISYNQTKHKDFSMGYSNNSQDKQFSVTIQEEFQKMRHGFAKKLQKLSLQNNQKQQKLKKQIFNLEKELENIQRQQNVHFKKYQFLLNSSQ